MAKREALGSGLEELFGEMNAVYEKSVATNAKQIYEIQIASISPNPMQPRKVFDTKSLDELAQSIEKHGLLQPIIVRQGEKNGYMLVAGERRYRAMKLLGYKTIPAIIIDAKQHKMRELALIENIQRENLNPIELALCYQALIIEHNLTQEELSRIIQKSRTQLTNTLRLLELSKTAQELIKEEKITQGRIAKLYTYMGLKRVEVEEVGAGDIIALAGLPDINIGDTICDLNHPEKIPFVDIDEPTVSMTFSVNNGPFAGREGQFITSRHIRDRLFKELERNVSLRVKETASPDSFEVSGRGELHLAVLIETMRREGFELLVSRPKVIFKEIDGVKCEPIERLVVNVPDDCIGNVIEKLGRRKAEMVNMEPAESGHTKVEFKIPARGLIGYRTEFLTDTKGEGTMNHIFDSYEPYKGDIQARVRGTIVAFEAGKSVTYGLYNAQDKGELFIGPGVDVYEGMIVGLNSRGEDLSINVCKEKHLTNTRASGSDEALRLVPPIQMSLEKAIEFIQDDELVEVTPKSIRLRKKILDTKERERANRNRD